MQVLRLLQCVSVKSALIVYHHQFTASRYRYVYYLSGSARIAVHFHRVS